jgi:hypothetical protein
MRGRVGWGAARFTHLDDLYAVFASLLQFRLTLSLCLTWQKNLFLLEVRPLAGDFASVSIGKSLCGLEFGGGGGAEFGSRRLKCLRQAISGLGVGRLSGAHRVLGSVGRPAITATSDDRRRDGTSMVRIAKERPEREFGEGILADFGVEFETGIGRGEWVRSEERGARGEESGVRSQGSGVSGEG